MVVERREPGAGMLAVRLVGGLLLAAHGGQKLFGWFEGPGPAGWQSAVESMGMKPAKIWAPVGALSEFAGGVLTALGFLNPLGPLGAIAAMTVATRKVHWGKPVFVTKGGAELPLTNIGIALAVALEGPGKYSLDHVLGIRIPVWGRLVAGAALVGGLISALSPSSLNRIQASLGLQRFQPSSDGGPA